MGYIRRERRTASNEVLGLDTFYRIGRYNRVRLYYRFVYIKAAATMKACK
jgi:hypothetical protein